MIYYETVDWGSQIFRVHGTILARVWAKWLLFSLYMLAAYLWCKHTESDLGKIKSNILGSTLMFLLVFRANTGYQRYWESRTVMTHLFCDLREVVALALSCVPGGVNAQRARWRRMKGHKHEKDHHHSGVDHHHSGGDHHHSGIDHDQFDNRVCEERVNIIRWTLVLAIAVQLHTRIMDEGLTHNTMERETKWHIDWDRYRIRHLTTAEEFKGIDMYVRRLVVPHSVWDSPALDVRLSGAQGMWDSPCPREGPDAYVIDRVPAIRLPLVVLYKLNQMIMNCVGDPRKRGEDRGMPERFSSLFVGFSTKILHSYSEMSQVIATPLPFPYFHLCKTLLFAQFLAFPFFIEYQLGFWANVVEPSFLALALLGVDAIAIELENPFGSDDNDLDMYEKIANLEEEVMLFIELCGDRQCRDSFLWLDMPEQLTEKCVSPIDHFLALRTMVESDGQTGVTVFGGDSSGFTPSAAAAAAAAASAAAAEDDDGWEDDSSWTDSSR